MKKNENLNKFQKAFDRLKQQWNEEPKTVPQVIYRKGKLLGFNLLDTAVSAYAGQAAFMMILSFFPFVMFMLVLLQRFPLSPELLITALEHFVPQSFRTFMTDIINNIYTAQTATLLPVTVIAALWLGSKSFLSIIYGLNSVYKIPETRGYFTLRLWAMFYTLLFTLLIIATLILFVFGNQLYLHITKIFPLLTHILLPIISFRSTAGFFVMLLFFTGMYVLIPNHRLHGYVPEFVPSEEIAGNQIRPRRVPFASQLPGALAATIGWLGFSFLYSFYVDHISNYSSIYGTMTTIALLMVWLYACMYILFFGGWLNYTIQRFLNK